ncbi:class I SAM-dependent methyltransferase [Skermania sp. ID1734]|uniref:class I SAM-dependent methyltransferase n=1 Tax=Skermania sp. ID1734 TaxID=2597516 RepID=UPI00117D5491|nr:class I SAM-dependent methyltransferase [Skermania sp. ID1734]TSD94463.1 class I SAM-dependent methyltransferase [Skermania sp. ID1734]
MAANRVRRMFVDSPTSVGARFRHRRWELFGDTFGDIENMRVLDLGGTVEAWLRAPVRPAHVTVVNLYEPGHSEDPSIRPLTGDACQAADALADAGFDADFDLVFSNSLIEHVGGHARRSEFAQQVRKLAPRHWVQTPYRYFPVEPHWLFPGMQFLPVAARVKVATHWPLVHTRPSSVDEARNEVLWTELVGITEMKEYFPGSTILQERMLGLTKSLIAVRS